MSHRFRFTKDCMDRLKRFAKGENPPAEEAVASTETASVQEAQPSPRVGLIAFARTDVGRVRATNQDALISAEGLWGVADGMGGHNGGETASAGARDALTELLKGKEPSADALREAICEVNARLFRQQKQETRLAGMGTTLTALWFSPEKVLVGHVGDSRAYRLREGELEQLTSDHSLVAELRRAGVLTPEQAENHPMRNVITRAVGTEEGIETEIIEAERRRGDRYLVCSDGLHGMVSEQELKRMLASGTPESACGQMIDAALAAGGRDNISVVVLHDQEGKA